VGYSGAGAIPNLDSIAEFRMLTNNTDAEYGNYAGAQINVVTKSGTNQWHGNVFEFLRNTDLDAKNYFDVGNRGAYNQNQFGGTFGGPVKYAIRSSSLRTTKATVSFKRYRKPLPAHQARPQKQETSPGLPPVSTLWSMALPRPPQ